MAGVLTKEIAAHVLWYYGKGGYPPGSFTMRLMETIKLADSANEAKLAQVFPEYVSAMRLPLDLLQAVFEQVEG